MYLTINYELPKYQRRMICPRKSYPCVTNDELGIKLYIEEVQKGG
jgi:hypothetical protein